MTAVTVVEADSSYIHGQFGLCLARVLVAASGNTYTPGFAKIKSVQAHNESNGALVWASESSAGVLTIGTAAVTGAGVATNNVVSLSIWGTY
jgi:hypothetical protein